MKNVRKYFCLAFLFLVAPLLTQAAVLSFTPASGSFNVGQTFTAGIIVATPNQAMNAVSGVVSFPADLLEVTSLSKGGSIVGLWVQEPAFSNPPAGGLGTVNFEGVALNPGFTGNSGRVLGVNFRIKRAGAAKLAFQTPAVLANDGQGTNILQSIGEANFQLNERQERNILNISSPTHPDSTKWYRATTAKFIWDLPEGANALKLLVSQSADAKPNVNYVPPVSEKEVTEPADGIWYLHAQVKTVAGWGEIAHFRFRIDTHPPTYFTLLEEPGRQPEETKVKLKLEAADELSGLDYYAISIDGNLLPPWRPVGDESYELPPLEPGTHLVTAQAVDRAGNVLDATLSVGVQSPAPSAWWRLGTQTVAALSLAVPLLALVILLGLMLEHSQRRFRRWRRRVREEVREAEESIGKAFDLLREDLEKQLVLLERTKSKRDLTHEEARILTHVRKNLRTAEKYIKKEIEDIEKEVK